MDSYKIEYNEDTLDALSECDEYTKDAVETAILSEDNFSASRQRSITEIITLGRNGYIDTFNITMDAELYSIINQQNKIVKQAIGAPHIATKIIYLLGLRVTAAALLEKGGTGNKIDDVLTQKYIECMDKAVQFKKLEAIYKMMTPEAFIVFCSDNDIEYKEFLETYTWRNSKIKHSTRRLLWLHDFIISNGGSAKVSDIQIAAKASEIVTDDKDWQTLSTYASRLGMCLGGDWVWNDKAQSQWEKVLE